MIDKETRENLSEGEKWQNFVEGEMWQKAREKLFNKMIDIQSTKNIDTNDPQKAVYEIGVRNGAIDMVMSWIQDIEGQAEQHEFNSQAYTPEEIIRRSQ